MKTKLLLVLTLFIAVPIMAQRGINYKAVVKDGSGNLVTNQDVSFKFKIQVNGALLLTVYEEEHTGPTVETDDNGLVILTIGEGSVVVPSGPYSAINWGSTDDYLLDVMVDIGAGYVPLGSSKINAVPFALHAGNVSGLELITEGGNSGWRLIGRAPADYGDIGNDAVDFSTQSVMPNIGATGVSSFAVGIDTYSTGLGSGAFGNENVASGWGSIVGGFDSGATGDHSFAVGNDAQASGARSVAFGDETRAIGGGSFAIGSQSEAIGLNSFAIGTVSTAFGVSSFAGASGTANGSNAFAWQGSATMDGAVSFGGVASGVGSFAGAGGTASGNGSFAYGGNATGNKAVAFGEFSTAAGSNSFAVGEGIITSGDNSVVVGAYNVDFSDNAFVVGNGAPGSANNALMVSKSGKTTVTESTNSAVNAINGFKTHVSGNNDGAGVYGENTVTTNFGFGVLGVGNWRGVVGRSVQQGVRGESNSIINNNHYGVFGEASGINTATNYGVYGNAANGGTNYAVYAAGNLAYTGSLINASDRKLKTNINAVSNALTSILQLKPSTYSIAPQYVKNMNMSSKPQFGFIAQELQDVFPDLVSVNKHSVANSSREDTTIEYLGVNYTAMIPILTAGMQEQQKQIAAQQTLIEQLMARIEALENK